MATSRYWRTPYIRAGASQELPCDRQSTVHALARRSPPLLLIASVVFACGVLPDAGTALADKLRNLDNPLVASVTYDSYNGDSGPYMMIVMKPGVTGARSREFGCKVVIPEVAAVTEELPEEFVWDVLDTTREQALFQDNYPCPAD